MEQWIKRTKASHFGAFSESYPHPAPFSSDPDADAKLVSSAKQFVDNV